jgi:hypothetical protein
MMCIMHGAHMLYSMHGAPMICIMSGAPIICIMHGALMICIMHDDMHYARCTHDVHYARCTCDVHGAPHYNVKSAPCMVKYSTHRRHRIKCCLSNKPYVRSALTWSLLNKNINVFHVIIKNRECL